MSLCICVCAFACQTPGNILWGQGFIGGDYQQLGGRLLATSVLGGDDDEKKEDKDILGGGNEENASKIHKKLSTSASKRPAHNDLTDTSTPPFSHRHSN